MPENKDNPQNQPEKGGGDPEGTEPQDPTQGNQEGSEDVSSEEESSQEEKILGKFTSEDQLDNSINELSKTLRTLTGGSFKEASAFDDFEKKKDHYKNLESRFGKVKSQRQGQPSMDQQGQPQPQQPDIPQQDDTTQTQAPLPPEAQKVKDELVEVNEQIMSIEHEAKTLGDGDEERRKELASKLTNLQGKKSKLREDYGSAIKDHEEQERQRMEQDTQLIFGTVRTKDPALADALEQNPKLKRLAGLYGATRSADEDFNALEFDEQVDTFVKELNQMFDISSSSVVKPNPDEEPSKDNSPKETGPDTKSGKKSMMERVQDV